ncbi:MAG TPA: hypothetical protein VIP77_19595 [Jiangellaceae bacterium]
MTAPYDIKVTGCDDSTSITVDLTPEQLAFLTEIAEKITATSTYSCEPRMSVAPHMPYDENADEPW